ncbi:hypothetical protein BJ944DRAFT_241342 [Cunninghamella echinulata]|nr:hypothetical protein BJ944DRAFT_241342 [Cunninghamella echinulata]
MPPNAQPLVNDDEMKNNEEQQEQSVMKLKDHFWSCDTRGIDQLMDYLNKAVEDLDQLQQLYLERAELEFLFGQKLDTLAKSFTFSTSTKKETGSKSGVSVALSTVNKELVKSAQSHINLSQRLQNNVATSLKEWVEKHKESINKIKTSILNTYENLQDHIEQLYNVREEYQSLDRENPKRQTLQNEYRMLLNKIDGMAKQYNEDWNDSCDQIEELEQDRIEFFATNVWDYANLASARLMIQDQRCEEIRNQLELCTAEDERNYCIQEKSVGKRIPTTSDYVSHYFNNKKPPASLPKKKPTEIINKELPKPQPPQEKPSPVAPVTSFSSTVKRKPVDQSTYKDKKKSAPAALEELLKKFETKSDASVRQKQQPSRKSYQPQSQNQQQRSSKQHLDNDRSSPVHNNNNNSSNDTFSSKMKSANENEDRISNDNKNRQQQKGEPIHDKQQMNKYDDSPQQDRSYNHCQQQPLSLEEKKDSTNSLKDMNKEEGYSNISENSNQTLHQTTTTTTTTTTPVMPPKSPRPKPNQVTTAPYTNDPNYASSSPPSSSSNHVESQYPSSPRNIPSPINTSYNYLQQQQQVPSGTLNRAPSPMMSTHAAPVSPMLYSHSIPQQQQYHQHHQQQQQHTLQPIHSPMMPPAQQQQQQQQQAFSPSPRSPNMVNAMPHSPILIPTNNYQHHPHNNNLNTNIPPPSPHVSRPNSPYLSFQPTLSPRPSSPCIPRPTLLPDRREILFWCHALYDYIAQDPSELSFSAQEMFAVYNAHPDGWWEAVSWDGYYFGRDGSIPSNFMQQC